VVLLKAVLLLDVLFWEVNKFCFYDHLVNRLNRKGAIQIINVIVVIVKS